MSAADGEGEIDFEDLLRRYMRHVLLSEGCNFVDWMSEKSSYSGISFTPEEVAAAERLDREGRSLP